jgi:hypothetical protein
MTVIERVKSWYIRWPWAAYRIIANLRIPLNINVRWEGIGLRAAVYRARSETYDRLNRLYADEGGGGR